MVLHHDAAAVASPVSAAAAGVQDSPSQRRSKRCHKQRETNGYYSGPTAVLPQAAALAAEQAPASAQAAASVQAASAVKAITAEEDKEYLGEEDEEEYKEEEEEYEDEDEEYEDEDEEEEEVGGHAAPPMAAAPLIVPVVGNHNQQRNHVNANFEGSSSHLAILYEPLLGTFSK